MKNNRHANRLAADSDTYSLCSKTERLRSGQALVETCIVISVICLVFMGLFQVSQVFASREILYHSAARGARGKTVGFNHFMVDKCMRVAAIPNSGRMLAPQYTGSSPLTAWMSLSPGELWDRVLAATPASGQYDHERVRIPEYLGSWNEPRARVILDYEHWDTLRMSDSASLNTVDVHVQQDYPLWVPMHRTFYGADSASISGHSEMECHYMIYLDDEGW